MSSRPILHVVTALAIVLLLALVPAWAQETAAPSAQLTVANIFREGGITGHAPDTVRWSPDGTRVSFILRDDSGEHAELWYADAATSKKAVLVASQKLSNLAPPPTSAKEREKEWRSRYSVAAYHWSPDSKHLLFDALGQLWLYDLQTGTAVPVSAAAEPVSDPRFSPNGRYISYVQNHNLYVRGLNDGHAVAVTHDTDPNLLNGEVDWVYAEELEVRHNYVWSADSRHILFLQMDETHVPAYPIADLIPVSPSVDNQKYPKPGDSNPAVRLGVVGAGGGKVQWIKLPVESSEAAIASQYYIPRFGWLRKGMVWVQVLNRAQNQLDLYFIDVGSGRSRLMLSEKDPYWVEVNDNFSATGDHFVWTSWRDGYTHIYMYSFNAVDPLAEEAHLERQLTHGDFEVFNINALDEERHEIYFTCNAGDPRQRQLYRVKFDGSGMERVSREDGTHSVLFGGPHGQYVDEFSAIMTPPRLWLCGVDGGCRTLWEAHSVEAYQLVAPKFVDFKADDGTLLYGLLLMPPNASGKVPVLLDPYGGPGAQGVRNIWGGGTSVQDASTFLFHQILAREGIAVLWVDNRGMAGRGRAFAAFAKNNFDGVEIKDQLAALQQAVANCPQLDPSRAGFWGWSYGGTMTLWALTQTQAFRAGVAVAPVANWRDYDSIYTERYLGLPSENPEVYIHASPVTTAAGLHGKLLLVHGTGDDNVHFQNSIQMTEAFIQSGKRFELMVYPRKTHGISGAHARTDLFTRIQRHFEKELLGRP
jgi:dipeptidyl-peptidase-4